MPLNKEAVAQAKDIINTTVPLVDYYNDYVDSAVDLSTYHKDCCPIHDEDSPSFHYFADTERFYCFGCNASGKTVDLHLALQKRIHPDYTIIRAIRDLGRMYNIELPNLFSPPPKAPSFFEKSHRVTFKAREQLQKPYKRVLNDFLSELALCKKVVPVSEYMGFMGDFEQIMFLNRDIPRELEALTARVVARRKEDTP